MQKRKAMIAGSLAALFLATSVSSASAQYYYHHRGPGPVLGLVGGVIVGAATIATLPFALLGAAIGPRDYYEGPPPPRYGYGPGYGYGPPPAPAPRYYYRRNYYGPPGYYGY